MSIENAITKKISRNPQAVIYAFMLLFFCIILLGGMQLVNSNHIEQEMKRAEAWKSEAERISSEKADLEKKLGIKLSIDSKRAVWREYIMAHKHVQTPATLVDTIIDAAEKASAKHNIDVELILAVMHRESNFNPWLQSSAGARGIMQVMPVHWIDTKSGEHRAWLFDIYTCTDKGAMVLRKYIDRFGLKDGISAYNMGSGNAARGRRNLRYVKVVLAYLENIIA